MAPPQWVLDRVRREGGCDERFIMEKDLQHTDLSSHQNRLLVPKRCVIRCLLPALSQAEKDAANLLHYDPNAKKKKNKNKGSMPRVLGKSHGGLQVEAFLENGWRFFLELTKRDSNSVVFKGAEWRLVRLWSGFKTGDRIQMWVFRRASTGKLCLAMGKNKATAAMEKKFAEVAGLSSHCLPALPWSS